MRFCNALLRGTGMKICCTANLCCVFVQCYKSVQQCLVESKLCFFRIVIQVPREFERAEVDFSYTNSVFKFCNYI
jgi:hypothetical protein